MEAIEVDLVLKEVRELMAATVCAGTGGRLLNLVG
jgi:hypothetical protein